MIDLCLTLLASVFFLPSGGQWQRGPAGVVMGALRTCLATRVEDAMPMGTEVATTTLTASSRSASTVLPLSILEVATLIFA